MDEGINSGHESGRGSIDWKGMKRKRSRKRRDSRGSEGSDQVPPPGRAPEERQKESDGRGVWQQTTIRKQDTLPIQEDRRTRFYEDYRKVAEEYDREFLKKYDQDLDTTLIFAGLFSAVTSAFIIDVNSKLQPDANYETVALLRVLIYKIDNTTFGNDVPQLPQWSGPPPTISHVQAVLFLSLALALFSAFLAMLGKQWLNRYASADMRGSAIERYQNRQQKLNGIVAWYFDSVMESLPFMLQVALLLLGCALSRYLWDVDIVVASVVLGVTSLGLLFYLFIVVAGAASEGCPYKTPGSNTLRSTAFALIPLVLPTIENTFKESCIVACIRDRVWLDGIDDGYGSRGVMSLLWCPVWILFATGLDIYRLCRAVIQTLAAPPFATYHLVYKAYRRLRRVCPAPEQRSDHPATALDLHCISWTLQTSLDKLVHTSALEYLVAITELPQFDPALVVNCFNIFIGCVGISNNEMVMMEGLESLAAMSATCLLRTSLHLGVMDPTSAVLPDLRRRYDNAFPRGTDYGKVPFCYTVAGIHILLREQWDPHEILWDNYQPPANNLISLARYIVDIAQIRYRQTRNGKVPRRTLRFALHHLSLDVFPPASVVADCLTVIAVDLGCDVSNIEALDESARISQVVNLLIRKLRTMVATADQDSVFSRRKALSVLFSYAVRLEQDRQQWIVDSILRLSTFSKGFMWRHIGPYTLMHFGKLNTPFLHQAIPLIFPGIDWDDGFREGNVIVGWAAAASGEPYTEEAGQNVVRLLLRFAYWDELQPHIPIDIWAWLKKQPSLPPACRQLHGTYSGTVRYIRGLGDIELLKSYFLVVWSEWGYIFYASVDEMEDSIREDFGGITMQSHREDLIERLDCVLGRLYRGLEYLKQYNPEITEAIVHFATCDYERLKKALLEVGGG